MEVEQRTCDAYTELLQRLGDEHDSHVVRIWNFVPSILADAGAGLNRYMRFNAGRHRAFRQWLGSENHFDDKLPAASAVGIEGTELVIHALVLPAAGVTVHNPRQRAPHRYSTRFGPLPPCFARATLIDHADLGRSLLVGGTASVRGEDSVHRGKLDLQLRETIENLEAVARAAFEVPAEKALSCYRELRVYHPRRQDEPVIRSAIVDRFPALRRIEFVVADLCRPELLVEIEGLAGDVARPVQRS